jgi:hypothetical protein
MRLTGSSAGKAAASALQYARNSAIGSGWYATSPNVWLMPSGLNLLLRPRAISRENRMVRLRNS